MMIKLFESWRKFKTLKEDVLRSEDYGSSFAEFLEKIEKSSNKTWIFFDTETTGLASEKDYNQITQIAAIAVNVNGFKDKPEILEKFNIKVKLADRTKGFMGWEKEKGQERVRDARAAAVDAAPGVKRVRQGKLPFKTIPDIFRMTGYGVSPNKEKAKRSAFLNAPEGTKLGDVPASVKFVSPVDAARQFIEFLDKYPRRVLVAQNAPFDVGYVNNFYTRAGMQPPHDIVFDTVNLFRKFLVPGLKKFQQDSAAGVELSPEDSRLLRALTSDKGKLTVSLGKLIKAFDVENKGWHDALADVTMLLDVMGAVIDFISGREDISSLPPSPDPKPRNKNEPDKKPSDID